MPPIFPRFPTFRPTRDLVLVLALVVGISMVVAAPALLLIPAVLGLGWFCRVWMRNVWFLMHLEDNVFPGRNDKLIWAGLMTLAAPLGLYLFVKFRAAHWPESAAHAKPKPTMAHEFD